MILPEKAHKHLEGILKPFFHRYDKDGNHQLDRTEFVAVLHDLGEHIDTKVSETSHNVS